MCELWLCGGCVVVVWVVGLIGFFFLFIVLESGLTGFFLKFKVCNCCFSAWGG